MASHSERLNGHRLNLPLLRTKCHNSSLGARSRFFRSFVKKPCIFEEHTSPSWEEERGYHSDN
jgi:hypothetical protein